MKWSAQIQPDTTWGYSIMAITIALQAINQSSILCFSTIGLYDEIGRHNGLKIRFSKGSVGSNPTMGTI